MNWPLFWALTLTFGFIVGNIMLVKHSAKQRMPSLKDHQQTADVGPQPSPTKLMAADTLNDKAKITPPRDQTPNTPE
ncbi:DUF2897 family protein [Alishewanella tabrizica]|uniref:DUF2897 domain-containing protein n=1 Tax=Alishewanella tabrizica TaxID=671278 RepID=A0ABQ2WQ97_9ALTE|nr:DUF2897 family protein [Alishewanella tabrizica]GGW68109.1 hypothetical protein GCM10008111_25280 [Alishewanella tabrizica]